MRTDGWSRHYLTPRGKRAARRPDYLPCLILIHNYAASAPEWQADRTYIVMPIECRTMTPRLTEWGQRCSRKGSINGTPAVILKSRVTSTAVA